MRVTRLETAPKSVMRRVVTAAALAAALWAAKEWIRARREGVRPKRDETESWENEGGALAPHPAGLETSQVPR